MINNHARAIGKRFELNEVYNAKEEIIKIIVKGG